MKTSNLIDMFGLSGDPSSDDQLDDLLFRLESDIPNALHEEHTCLPSFIATPIAVPSAGMFFSTTENAEKKFQNFPRGS